MVCATVACSASVDGAGNQDGSETRHSRVGRAIQPIIGGTASGTDQNAVVALVDFHDGVRWALCTAALVAPNLVLTARHCVSETDSPAGCASDGTTVTGGMVKSDKPVQNLYVFVGNEGAASATLGVEAAAAQATQLVFDSTPTVCNHDVAFVVLDRPVNAPTMPIRIGAPVPNESLTAIGWGVTSAGTLPSTRQQRAAVLFMGNGPMAIPTDPRYGAGDAEFIVGESSCAGDSGGPLVASTGALLGIASREGNGQKRDPYNYASTCVGDGVHSIYTHLKNFEPLIQRAFAAAGAQPVLDAPSPAPEAPPAADGASCGDAGTPCPRAPSEAPTGATVATGNNASPDSPAAESSGGCSATKEPLGSVEQALGATAAIWMLLGLRRKRTAERS